MILLTRPYKDSVRLAERLEEKEHLIEPMMEIKQLEIDLSDYINDKIQAIVVTSKNVKYFSDIKIPEHGKNAKQILNYCIDNLGAEAGKILYLSGNNITLDISKELREEGFDSERVVTYKQIPSTEFSKEFLENFDKIKTATFFSKHTLKNFLKLAEKSKLNLKNINCLCISDNVSRETSAKIWKTVKSATTPNRQGMLDLINTIE